jgi:hypothetical protein
VHWSLKGCPQISDAEYLSKLKSKLILQPNGCRTMRSCHPEGYGGMSYRGRAWRAHLLMYKLTQGDVPPGMVVMHICDNPPCCNPDHLRLGTKADNNRDMFAKKRNVYNPAHYTKCKSGHEFTPENTAYSKEGHRKCKRCQLIKCRVAAGWPRELAETLPVTPKGHRPVGASYKNPVPKVERVRSFSTHGSSPRQRAWRARQKAKRQSLAQS